MTGEVHEWEAWIHKSMVLNQNNLPHWGTANPIKKDLKLLGKAAGRALRKKFVKVRMTVRVSYPTAASADASNYYPTMKAYVDGMVDRPPTVKGQKQLPARGCLADDSDAYFDGPHLTGTMVKSGRKDWFRFDCRLEVIE